MQVLVACSVTLFLTAATLADADRIAALCSSGQMEVTALMLRPDNLTRALECVEDRRSNMRP